MTVKQKRRAGGGAGAGAAVLVVWIAGYLGLSMSAEIGAIVATVAIAAGAEIWSHGIRGVIVHIWAGDADDDVVVKTDDAKVVLSPTDAEHPQPEVHVSSDN